MEAIRNVAGLEDRNPRNVESFVPAHQSITDRGDARAWFAKAAALYKKLDHEPMHRWVAEQPAAPPKE